MSSFTHADVSLEAITESDFEAVAVLGATIWRSHYAAFVSIAQIDYMLAGRYAPDTLRAYLNAETRWMDILKLAGRPIGYCSASLTDTPSQMKLEQLYLLHEFRGKGLGGFMLRHVESKAREHGLGVMMLQVNKRNIDSIAFYRKTGFTVREEAIFDIGHGFVMDDYVMEKVLFPRL